MSFCRIALLVITRPVDTVAVVLVSVRALFAVPGLYFFLFFLFTHLKLPIFSPACLQSVRCDNFHERLSRRSGVIIGNHLLKKLQRSTLTNESSKTYELETSVKPANILIGRAPFSPQRKRSRFADVDDIELN